VIRLSQTSEASAASTAPITPIQNPHLALSAYSVYGVPSSFRMASRERKIPTIAAMKLSGPERPIVLSRMPIEMSDVKKPARAWPLPGGSGAGCHCP
jgi:hypothetical protein